jgi:hypothetical protein
MTEHQSAHPLEWKRFVGSFANAGDGDSRVGVPTVGTAWHRCDCCGRGYLVIAAIAPDGREVNVALHALVAIDLLEHAATLVETACRNPHTMPKAFLQ